MKLASFHSYMTLSPTSGAGYAEGASILLTESEIERLPKDQLRKATFEHVGSRQWNPNRSRLKCGFYYPGGVGDELCHTAVAYEFKKRYPNTKLRVYSKNPAVWLGMPGIEDGCARPWQITKDIFKQNEGWLLGDGVVYRDRTNRNIYEVLEEWCGFELTVRKPVVIISEQEKSVLATSLMPRLGFDIRDEKVLLFAPQATKHVRSWPMRHWVPFIHSIEGYKVVAVGYGKNAWEIENHLKPVCRVMANLLTPREVLVLASMASMIVSVDSAMVHAGAAFDVPTVAIMGPFSPNNRTETYRRCEEVWMSADGCPVHCMEHEDGVPTHCPNYSSSNLLTDCRRLDNAFAGNVMDAIERLKK